MARTPCTSASIPFYRNVRVLTMLAQVAFALAVCGLGWLLIGTMLRNLDRQGIPISFAFLQHPAGFGISEGPRFDPSQSYLAAFGVGVVNTMRVALAGVGLATLLGLSIGVARLSPNWLLSRLATAYVEVFRNVPLLLWLVFTYATLRVTLPRLRQSLTLVGETLLMSNRGVALPWPRASATFVAFVPWLAAAAMMGLLTWAWLRRRAVREAGTPPGPAVGRAGLVAVAVGLLGYLATGFLAALPEHTRVALDARTVYVDANRNNVWDATEPVLPGVRVLLQGRDRTWAMQSRVDGRLPWPEVPADAIRQVRVTPGAPLYWSVPRISGFNYQGGLVLTPEFTALLLGLVIYTAAFIAEVVRAGIQAVPKGQREAAQALGLSGAQTFRHVIFPQALRVIIPPLINQYLNLTKNSSLAIAVGYPDLFSVGLTINNQTGQAMPFVIMIMVTYLSMSLLTSLVMNLLNRRLALKS